MSIHRAGTLPAPHQHIAISVAVLPCSFVVQYVAQPKELFEADIVTSLMEEKILNQRSGSHLDERGRQSKLIREEDGAKRRPKRVLWESSEPITASHKVPPTEVEDLPGVRELYPDGIPEYEKPRSAALVAHSRKAAHCSLSAIGHVGRLWKRHLAQLGADRREVQTRDSGTTFSPGARGRGSFLP